jgi:uncharacterized damage-inducible protein DinB
MHASDHVSGGHATRNLKWVVGRAGIADCGDMENGPDPISGDLPETGRAEDGDTRSFGWSDMFVRPEDDPRTDGGFSDERTTLVGYLRDYRLTLELKCAGLDAGGMARKSVEPSNLSLLGLVRHLADVERNWFRRILAGQDTPWLYRRDDDRDAAFNEAIADPGEVASAWATWRAEVSFAEQFTEQAPDLEVSGTHGQGERISLREVLVHMIEEYARHAGHADLLRERIDGRVGQ